MNTVRRKIYYKRLNSLTTTADSLSCQFLNAGSLSVSHDIADTVTYDICMQSLMTGLHADQSLKTKILKAHDPPDERFLIEILLKNAVFGSSERLPPLSAVPPTNKKTHPPISKPHPATKSFVHHSFLMCKCFCFCATATSTLHCLMFLHPPPRGVFGPSVKFQDAKTEKKHHLPNDGFLTKILLKNDVFGAQKGYPPWARSPPQIKRRTPQLVNPTQPGRVFSHHAFLMCKCFVFLQRLHQHCIAWCFLINLPGVCLVHLLNFKTPKPKKNIISLMMDF